MQNDQGRKCGHEVAVDAARPDCTHVNGNGAVKPQWIKPPPPPEVANWVIEPVPPELAEEFRRTFDEAAFLAEADEALRTGGVPFEEIMAMIERKVHGNN